MHTGRTTLSQNQHESAHDRKIFHEQNKTAGEKRPFKKPERLIEQGRKKEVRKKQGCTDCDRELQKNRKGSDQLNHNTDKNKPTSKIFHKREHLLHARKIGRRHLPHRQGLQKFIVHFFKMKK